MTKKILTLITVSLSLWAATASGTETAELVGSSTPTEASSSNAAQSQSGQTFSIGDTVKLGNWQLVVNSLTDPQPPSNKFEGPAAGNRWISLDITVQNVGSTSSSFIGQLAFEVQDTNAFTYRPAFTGVEPQAPSGEIAPGAQKRGIAVFEVPETATTGLVLNFEGKLFDSGIASIKLN